MGAVLGPPHPISGSATVLGDLQVRFDGVEATLMFVSDKQTNAAIPLSVAGKKTATMELLAKGVLRSSRVLPVAAAAVGIFTSGGGSGQALAVNPGGTLNSPANPVDRRAAGAIFVPGTGAGPGSGF